MAVFTRAALAALAMTGMAIGACASDEPARVTPRQGRAGESLRIEGSGFVGRGPAVVYLGPRAAKSIVIESDSLLTARAPEPDAPGLVPVRVEFGDGHVVELADGFTYEEGASVGFLSPRKPE